MKERGLKPMWGKKSNGVGAVKCKDIGYIYIGGLEKITKYFDDIVRFLSVSKRS